MTAMDDPAIDLYMEGMGLYGQGRFEEAIAKFTESLVQKPDWGDCLQALGMAQMHHGKVADSLETLKRCAELEPENPLVFTSLSMAYQRADRIEEAEAAQAKARMLSWQEELKTNPNAPPPDDGMPVQQ